MSRQFWVLAHHYAGLAMTVFLVIVGLTGSVIAFREELDVWLNLELLTVAKRDVPMLDALELRDKAVALYPNARLDAFRLHLEPGRSFEIGVMPQADAGADQIIALYLDPYTGEKLGVRAIGEVSLAKENILFFLLRLHYSLALPASTGSLGGYILGATALIWSIDCFVSFYLTLPLRRRQNGGVSPSSKSWWSRWKPAWLIKFNAGAYRINFDIHRVFGLWTWAMLFVFAWSSVGFNLNQVYTPTMNTLFGLSQPISTSEARAEPLEHPRLDWRAAHEIGRALLDEQASQHGATIEREEVLSLDRVHGVYMLVARSSFDRSKQGGTFVSFDADTGALRRASWPGSSSELTGDVISRWLFMLHMAAVFGLPMKILVCVMGLGIATLSITGVYIWLKKRRARMLRAIRKA
jgi:uncharacterized iron-regulated membrane protein